MSKFHTLLIDGDVTLHRAVAAGTTHVRFDEEEHWQVDLRRAGAYIREQLQGLKAQFGAKRVLIALGDRTANFRKELCPTYKANRTNFPKPPGFLELERRLRAHAKVVQIPRLEGDDVLGLMLTKLPDALCVSVDKDLLQVPGAHYNPDKDVMRVVDPDEGAALHLFQTLTGDCVDGYPGCPGVGPVKAAAILSGEIETAWERVVEAFEKTVPQLDDDGGTPKLWQRAEQAALLQARLAFVLRQGYYDTKTKEITLWLPNT